MGRLTGRRSAPARCCAHLRQRDDPRVAEPRLVAQPQAHKLEVGRVRAEEGQRAVGEAVAGRQVERLEGQRQWGDGDLEDGGGGRRGGGAARRRGGLASVGAAPAVPRGRPALWRSSS